MGALQLWPVFRMLGAGALIGLVLLVVGVAFEGADWMSRFFFAYLIGYAFVLGLTVGAVALVILTHLFRAGWVVAIRRVPETFAANFWFVAILSLPIIVAAMMPNAPLYPWSASLEVAQERLDKAKAFIHHHESESHGDDHAHARLRLSDDVAPASDVDSQSYFVAAAAGEYVHADGDDHDHPHDNSGGSGTAQLTEGYEQAAAAMAGMAYPEDREAARAIQYHYYQSMLGYMLDYKRYGGLLDTKIEDGVLVENGQVPVDFNSETGEVKGKGFTWYNPMLFALRMVIYFAVLSLIGWYYWHRSVKQDETKDPDLSTRREWWSPLSVTGFALTVTFMSFDLLMSLDPAWYSTMFGVIFFANAFTAGIAGTILVCMYLQKKGYLKTVNTEHYHDLAKLLFAFVFFWGYVSFSQYMLLWYASFPETAYWLEIHGMTTVTTAPQYGSGWTYISLLMLFGHLFVPFAFLLSRHVKRNLTALACAATWMLLMVYLDFYWYVMPFFESPGVTFGLPEIGAVVMLLSLVLAKFVLRFRQHAPVAHGDPRLHESTGLDTNVWAPIHH
ncbi:MAG: hypothetical protein ACPGYV_04390 [Phycisphaeraceae bacterium]